MSDGSDDRLIKLQYELLKERYGDRLLPTDDAEMTRRLEGFARAVSAIRAYPLTNGDTPLAAPEPVRGDR